MSEEIVTDYMIRIQELKQQLQLEKDNVAELNELLISYKEENEELKKLKDKLNSLSNFISDYVADDWLFDNLMSKI